MDERPKTPVLLDYASQPAQRGPSIQGLLVFGVVMLALAVLGFNLFVPRFGSRAGAPVAAARVMVGPHGTIKMALESFRHQLAADPGTLADLCERPPTIDREDNRWYPFLSACSLVDPWGNPLVYRRVAAGFDLITCGPDGKLNTADDIANRHTTGVSSNRDRLQGGAWFGDEPDQEDDRDDNRKLEP